MSNEPTAARKAFGDIAPALADYTDTVLFGDVWKRPGLSQRDRSLITVAALAAMTHIAIQEPRDRKAVDLMEEVSDEQYQT